MGLSHLEHFLVLTDDMEATREWYVSVLGLSEGDHPDFRFPVYWLYLNGRDVVHIAARAASQNQKTYLGEPAAGGGGNIDHVAFRCNGLAQMKARLDSAGAAYTERRVDDQALYQIFLHDPNGIKIELNFAAAEAAGLRAPVMAADLDA